MFSAEEEDDGSARQNSGSRTNSTESIAVYFRRFVVSSDASTSMISLKVPHCIFSVSVILTFIAPRSIVDVGNGGFVYWSRIGVSSF